MAMYEVRFDAVLSCEVEAQTADLATVAGAMILDRCKRGLEVVSLGDEPMRLTVTPARGAVLVVEGMLFE